MVILKHIYPILHILDSEPLWASHHIRRKSNLLSKVHRSSMGSTSLLYKYLYSCYTKLLSYCCWNKFNAFKPPWLCICSSFCQECPSLLCLGYSHSFHMTYFISHSLMKPFLDIHWGNQLLAPLCFHSTLFTQIAQDLPQVIIILSVLPIWIQGQGRNHSHLCMSWELELYLRHNKHSICL